LSFDRFGFELKDLKKEIDEEKVSKRITIPKNNTKRINSLDEYEKRNNEIPI
jgi:hypothetical protein